MSRYHQTGAIIPKAIPALCMIALFLLLYGCSAPPRWVGGTDRSPYYYQGVGTGPSPAQAERSAFFALCANINGIEVEEVIEDYQRERGTADSATVESDFKQWLKSYVSGKVPAEVRIAERWEGKGREWAYAIAENPGQLRAIDKHFAQHMANSQAHAFVPGWAQFQKGQHRKAWMLMAGVGVGLVGGASFAILSNDSQTRRDQSAARVLREHYDTQANQRFWISTAFYVLAGSTYLANVLDGFYSDVEPYQILAQVDPEMIRIAFRF